MPAAIPLVVHGIVAAVSAISAAATAAGPLVSSLITAGVSATIGAIGTLLSKGPMQGTTGAIRNPISPWNVVYGRSRVGGTTVYIQETSESNKYLHLVIVLACHPCEAVDYLLFDGGRVTLDTDGHSLSYVDSTAVIASNQTVSILSITRVADLVTVVLSDPFPAVASSAAGETLVDGDKINIHDVAGDLTLNGIFQVHVINSTTFTYTSGGSPASVTSSGYATTMLTDWGDTVHMQVALGTQSSGSPPFPDLLATDDTGSEGLWTSAHLLQGRTAVYLRLKYGGDTYAAESVPTIAFLVRGKNDVYDPRTTSYGYSENPALCIADYLAHTVWGFKAVYGTEIPATELISAANICDETVTLVSGATEPRYTCNGQFPLTTKRSEVLQNLLTSCGGRLTYVGGKFVIHPAAWVGASGILGATTATSGRAFATATLKVLSSHIPPGGGMTITAEISAHFPWGDSPSIGTGVDINDTSSWTLRTDTVDVRSYFPTLGEAANMVVSFRTQYAFSTGSLPDHFRIYDVWVDVTYADDGSGDTLRPSLWQVINSDGFPAPSTVTNGANAIDSDSGSYADIELTDYNIFAQFSKCLQVSGFTPGTTYTAGTTIPAIVNAAGPFTWKSKHGVRDLYNGVKGTYVSPANGWQSSDFPPYAQDSKHGYSSGSPLYPEGDANMAADGGDRRWLDVQLPFTTSPTTAQRLAKIELLRRRWQGNGTFAFNVAMYNVSALDVVAFTLPVLGWTNKLLEVTAHRFTLARDNDTVVLGTELDLTETDPSIYEWSIAEELSPQGYAQNPVLPDPSIVSPPTAVTAVSNSTTSVIGADGIARSRIKVTWTVPADGYVTNGGSIELRFQEYTSPASSTWTALPTVAPSVTQAYIDSVTDGHQYVVQVRAVNTAGVASAWVQAGPVTVSGTSSTVSTSIISQSGATSGQVLTWNGSAWVPQAASTITLQTNTVNNTLQNKLNLIAGTNVSLTAGSLGDVTIASTASVPAAVSQVPSGTLNGSNTSFTLTYTPSPAASLLLFLNGVEQVSGTDFTISSATITYTRAPKSTDEHVAAYTH